ncbi:nifR3 family TIM-barrel protein [Clostridium saccharoperbutylacetonicum]|uniref:tRNA-dihydrouridine synthase n=1 Tax=Clostridium saccharoperbutylacetonicum N1-4(HMT) TaxID=931276 RepID=M1MLS6_9CLOT|nr:tRNA-dihydrouridine synthase family protein [Clostridium saccharoperbutylacetonicum]AGF57188.1 putative tRNA-dihydrouridine synthase Dus [Clostridium saccharoperbutylacetonicum N1-4(HMT)]NRT62053.1 nifR3 family TIM-barrel protein [Clostridium saccharoperbutylacetonicum]NSB25383.1 nifR3 family TIM-barrel protein [Clostridium saccharoperbutylacetonicum]NSB44751.1 nifR3 family TIM-barrel protein [Clostridium saccharoperbutylacetonicum]
MEIKELRLGNIIIPCNVLMAPLAGYTCYPFRMLCYDLGAGLCYTEMVNCNALKYKDEAMQKLLFTTSDEKIKAAQLVGSDPRIMEKMARSEYLSEFDIIDINMGCPVPNVFKSGQGSALLGDLKRASSIIKGCKKSGKVITVKTRIGIKEDVMIAGEFAKMCEDAGADMVTIHGRSRNMMYYGTPYFNQIEQAKSVVKIPVIANGGIFSIEEAEKMMNVTGADGIMVARYALENPFIFSELIHKDIKKDKYTVISEQIDLTSKYYDEIFTILYIRRFVAYLMKGSKAARQYKTELYNCGNIEELKFIVKKIFLEERENY